MSVPNLKSHHVQNSGRRSLEKRSFLLGFKSKSRIQIVLNHVLFVFICAGSWFFFLRDLCASFSLEPKPRTRFVVEPENHVFIDTLILLMQSHFSRKKNRE